MKSLANGPQSAKIVLVTEGPDADDLPHGTVLADSHGKLLNDMLAAAGLRRWIKEFYVLGQGHKVQIESEIYCTCVSALPVPKESNKYIWLNRKTPTPEFERDALALRDELAELNPTIIIACGEAALVALTSKRGINAWQGSVIESTLLPGRKVIPVISPHKVMMQWIFRALAVRFFRRAREQSAFPEIRRPTLEMILSPSFDQAITLLEEYSHEPYISFDIETKANHIACIGFARSGSEGICIPFISSEGHYWKVPSQERCIWQAVAKLLEGNSRKFAQNALFDCSHLWFHGIRPSNIYIDTMLLQGTLYPELEKSLAILTALFTELPYYKDQGKAALKLKNEKAWSGKQADLKLWEYNVLDCLATFTVALAQMRDLDEFDAAA